MGENENSWPKSFLQPKADLVCLSVEVSYAHARLPSLANATTKSRAPESKHTPNRNVNSIHPCEHL